MALVRIEATVGSLAQGGDAVLHLELGGERRAVFVPHAAPGDRVRAEIDPAHRPARGRILELLEAGPDRVTPPCPVSGRCGGCDWMHLSVEAQRREHAAQARAALPAGSGDVTVESHPSPSPLGYRTRARVHVRSDRGGRLAVGMHEASSHDPVDVPSCAVLDPTLDRARGSLAALLAGSRGHGEVSLALGADRRAVLDVRWSGELAGAAFGRLERAVVAGELAGAQVTLEGANRPAVVGRPDAWVAGADGAPLRVPAASFAQANDAVSALLARHVAAIARRAKPDRAVELYAGAGTLSVLLAPECAELATVESNAGACAAARENLAARGLSPRVVHADAERHALPPATRLVVLDPPRTGALDVARRLAESRVRHVVYVACDVPTLRRDLQVLAPAYAVRSLATFEMFPQTSHVESVVHLERRRGGGGDR